MSSFRGIRISGLHVGDGDGNLIVVYLWPFGPHSISGESFRFGRVALPLPRAQAATKNKMQSPDEITNPVSPLSSSAFLRCTLLHAPPRDGSRRSDAVDRPNDGCPLWHPCSSPGASPKQCLSQTPAVLARKTQTSSHSLRLPCCFLYDPFAPRQRRFFPKWISCSS